MKPCRKCGSKDRSPSGKCRPCDSRRCKAYRKANKAARSLSNKLWRRKHPKNCAEYDKANPEQLFARKLWYKHRLTSDEYYSRLKEQGGVCAICKHPESQKQSMSVDHDHKCCPGARSCGKCFRGLLCHRCNTGIGLLGDSIDNLETSVKYLQAYILTRIA